MRIGELARRSGLTASRIRFYERIGLLTPVDRRSNGYRTYTADAVVLLDIVARAQRAGFSLDEIRGLLPTALETWQHEPLIEALRRKLADIEALQQRLAGSHAHLATLIADIEAKPDDIDCAANARRVLSRVLGTEGLHGLQTADGRLLARLSGAKARQAS